VTGPAKNWLLGSKYSLLLNKSYFVIEKRMLSFCVTFISQMEWKVFRFGKVFGRNFGKVFRFCVSVYALFSQARSHYYKPEKCHLSSISLKISRE